VIRFLGRRLGYLVLVLFVIALVSFGLNAIANNNPAALLAPRGADANAIAQIKANLHLNDPLYLQFWHFLTRGPDVRGTPTGLLHFPPSLGYSFVKQRPVTSVIADKLPATISLALGALVLWLAMSLPIGVLAATKARSLLDRIATFFALVGLSFPTFLLGLLLLYLLYYQLTTSLGVNLFPAGGYVPLTQDPLSWAHHLILPWFTLALTEAAIYVRITRGSMLEVLGEDYVRTARAKGLSERRVVYRHGLRSALTPVITLAGLDVATLLGGAVVTEQVFGIDGVGRLAVLSVNDGDLPVVVGVTLLASFFFVLSNVVVDVVYARLDARVRVN
jgi:peptide/nickel transport system permease protein